MGQLLHQCAQGTGLCKKGFLVSYEFYAVGNNEPGGGTLDKLLCQTKLMASQPQMAIPFQKQMHLVVLHFVLHPCKINSSQAGDTEDNLVQIIGKTSDSFQAEVRSGGIASICT